MSAFHQEIHCNHKKIGRGNSCYIIAEIGVNFDGSLERAKETMEAAAACGADAVKFQTFRADEFVSDKSLVYSYSLLDGAQVAETQYEMFKRLELPDQWHFILRDFASRLGVDFLSSAADCKAADLLMEIGAPALKIASEDLINIDLLRHIAGKNVPVILSTGMAALNEIEIAVDIFREADCRDLILMHCVSAYPTPLDECHLRRITALQDYFGAPVGFSDHSEGDEAAMISVALGACVIEKHFTLDRALRGPDHKMSADPKRFAAMVEKIRRTELILGADGFDCSEVEKKSRLEFRRSIVAKRRIAEGETITLDLLSYKRPGYGLKPYQRNLILGKKAVRNIDADQNILETDVNA